MKLTKLNDCHAFTAGDGSWLREILNPRKHKVRTGYSLAWARVKPGQETAPHSLKYSEVYYILKGRGIMRFIRGKQNVRTHDTIYLPPGAVQSIKNIGTVDLEFLCIVSPAWKPSCENIIRPKKKFQPSNRKNK
jgi:mannose-6-phosphate isomerase-like protein (cupin superfamily)